MVSIMYFEEVSVLLLLTKIHVCKISCWQKALLVKCLLAKSMLVQSLLENFVVALERRPFLFYLLKLRLLVVWMQRPIWKNNIWRLAPKDQGYYVRYTSVQFRCIICYLKKLIKNKYLLWKYNHKSVEKKIYISSFSELV